MRNAYDTAKLNCAGNPKLNKPSLNFSGLILAKTETLAIDIINIFIDKVRSGKSASKLPPAKKDVTTNIENNSVIIQINIIVRINEFTCEITAINVVYMIIVIKMVLLYVIYCNRLIIKYQTINNLASIFEKYTSGFPKAVLISSNLIVSTLSTSFILAVRSIEMHLLYSSHKFSYR